MHRVVPELIVENYRAGRYCGEFPAVGMFLDLSGFSTMTDALMQHGQHGAEVLAGLMHSVFDPLVESIFEYGGKIVGFAGDGIMALYPVETDEKTMALRALASAHVIQRRLEADPVRSTVYGKFPISARIGLAIGSVSWQILRSEDGRQATYYFRGSAVDDSAQAEHCAKAGKILLTTKLNNLFQDEIQVEACTSFHQFGGFRVELPVPTPATFPPIDLEVARLFMPEDVIAHDVRGEFRQVVNLFMRFPDLPDNTLGDFLITVFELHKKYGGLLTRLDFGDKGCNMLMLWGAPVAYENDIGRALNFVIDLKSKVDFPITAGVTYYIAHAGYLGSAMCEDYTCYGWGVNLASRFMMSAPDAGIWIDERIARRVKNRFDFEYQGAQHFKGFAAEQKVFSISGRKLQELFHQGELVGRESELTRLIDCVLPLWQRKFAGLTVIWGDAGIGKSRLAYELKASHAHDGRNVRWALCHSDQILRYSFNPFRYWLLRYFGIDSGMDDAAQKLAFDSKLNELIETIPDADLAGELDRVRSVLGALLDLYWADSFHENLDAEGRYNNTLTALIALVKAESLRQPVILFIEDAQFLDDDSKAFLPRLERALMAGNTEYPVAIIVSSRHVGTETLLTAELIDHSIELKALSAQALSTLAEIYLGGAASPELVQLLEERSEGNPYFAEQILIYLQEEKLLEMSDRGWKVVRQLQEASLPADIRSLLVARLDQLTRNVREVIQTAAVLGREFEVQILAEMLQGDEMLEKEIADAEKAEIWSAISQIKYIFTHGLLRDAAYAMQMNARRRELHALALSALETVYGDNPGIRYAEFAHHAEQGDLPLKAQYYYTQAGKISSASFQNEQAVEYFSRALAYTPLDDLALRFDLVSERVELFSRMGKRGLQLKDLNTLEQWANELDEVNRVTKVMMLRSAHNYFIGNYQESIRFAKQAEANPISAVNMELSLYTQVVWATSLLRLGRMNEAMDRAMVGLEMTRAVGNRKEECRVLNIMGLIAMDQKESTSVLKYFTDALEIARDVKVPDLEAKALNNLAMAEASINGNYARAHTYYEMSCAIARKIGDRTSESSSLGNLGFSAGMLGDFQLARSYHEQALRVAREVGNLYQEIYTLINISSLAGLQNDSNFALSQAQRAAELARATSERSGEAWAMLYMGHAHALLEQFELARSAYQRSIEIRNELEQPALSMEPIAGLVEIYLATSDLEAASQYAGRIMRFFESGSSLDGTDEPLRVYHACHCFLERTKDPRSGQVLQTAKKLLEAQISKFSIEADRDRYIENIPWRRAIRDA